MRIGLIAQMHGAPGSARPGPTWGGISRSAKIAEAVGFDSFVFEDALLYRGADTDYGCLESVSIAAALAATTSTIEIGQSVINSPYRSPALTAKIAATIDDISGGRYIFGIGAGNTADSDYAAFGFPRDKRYSRFAEGIEIIHGLLKTGAADFEGDYHFARDAAMVLQGPRPQGPPIIIAAGSPKMLRLVARYADGWNWWTAENEARAEALLGVIEELERACEEEGRDPSTLRRSLDAYTFDPLNAVDDTTAIGDLISGTADEMAAIILGFSELGFDEIRCDLHPNTDEAIEAMADVVAQVHAA